jgi:phenylpyruvate C(3)-methyltransferase
MMGHDFWPRDRCVSVLRRIRHTFPKAESLVLGDMCRSVGRTGADYPMFTLGFEIVHAVMNQYVPTLSEWNAVFGDGGWRLTDHRMIDMPASSFVYHLAPG